MAPPTVKRKTSSTKKRKQSKTESLSSENDKAIRDSSGTQYWAPNFQTAFKALASARLCAAVWNNISDCDETYNYWEPLHFLLHGTGFQTWEYSPSYALRSYTYVLLHALPAWLYELLLQSNKMLVFYFLRCLLAFFCTACESYFYKGVCHAFGANVGRLMLVFLLFSAGMFQASSAFLPSSFSMYLCMLSFGTWFHRKYPLAIFLTALSTFVSWPFAGIIGVGIAVDALLLKKLWRTFVVWCIISTATILVPMVAIDSSLYGRLVIAPLNIVLYNVFSEHGPDLYGTEPWTFYFVNGFLNFNFVFFMALLSLPLILVGHFLREENKGTSRIPEWLAVLPMYLWFAVFFTRPHKEERFLFPVYPLIALSAAFFWSYSEVLMKRLLKVVRLERARVTSLLTLAMIATTSLISISRIVAQYKGYHAPIDIFLELNRLSWEEENGAKVANVCVGKEWHRFPSSFFLPDKWRLLFLQSEFKGQLPKPYAAGNNATWIIPEHMNDLNLEEPSRYAHIKECHYLVDLESQHPTDLEPRYSLNTEDWTVINSIDYLDATRSPRLLRAFYVPWFTENYCKYIPYVLLAKKRPRVH